VSTIRVVKDGRITRTELRSLAQETYGVMIKAVADLDRGVLAFNGPMHKDIQAVLLTEGSRVRDMWGFCLHLDKPWVVAFEFRSHINARPEDGNASIQINNELVCRAIVSLAVRHVDWSL